MVNIWGLFSWTQQISFQIQCYKIAYILDRILYIIKNFLIEKGATA